MKKPGRASGRVFCWLGQAEQMQWPQRMQRRCAPRRAAPHKRDAFRTAPAVLGSVIRPDLFKATVVSAHKKSRAESTAPAFSKFSLASVDDRDLGDRHRVYRI